MESIVYKIVKEYDTAIEKILEDIIKSYGISIYNTIGNKKSIDVINTELKYHGIDLLIQDCANSKQILVNDIIVAKILPGYNLGSGRVNAIVEKYY